MPEAQEVMAPVEEHVNPAGQGSQEVASVASAYRPTVHGSGDSVGSAQAWPRGHSEQDCVPDCVAKYPVGQAVQDVDMGAAKVPAAQIVGLMVGSRHWCP